MGFVNIDMAYTDRGPNSRYWYHSLDFPDGTSVSGDWDLRGRYDDYIGNVKMTDKRVLDVGTASGFLAFEAEKAGASVVAFDMPVDGDWDVKPHANKPIEGMSVAVIEEQLRQRWISEATRYKRALSPMRDGFFYAHRKYASSVRLFEGSIYEIDAELGIFDVSILGSILLHLRDPFRALHRVAQLTTNKLIISDLLNSDFRARAGDMPILEFLPDAKRNPHAWWRISPASLIEMLRVVGFEVSSSAINSYKFKGANADVATLIADRVAV